MRLLLAGSSGFLGTLLRERLTGAGHHVTALVRREPGPDEVRWDPYSGALDPSVVDGHDVVVNLAGSPTLGNPHSARWRRELMESRVTTTGTLATAIATSDRKPAFLAGNATGYYGDHGTERVEDDTESRGDALLTRVSRAWQRAAEPAAAAGARVCYLRTAPVYDGRSQPLKVLRMLYRAGLGGPLGSGRQYVPLVSARDWTGGVLHLAEHDDVSGPVILSAERAPTNAELNRTLGELVSRPAVLRVPAVVLRTAAGDFSPELLSSVNVHPTRLLDSGYRFEDPDVRAVLSEGLSHR